MRRDPRERARWVRFALLAGLVSALILGSGCVYWRLHRLRQQFGDFARHFHVEANPGPNIAFLQPVLRTGDIEWLIDLPPTSSRTRRNGRIMNWTFEKRAPDGREDAALDIIECVVAAESGRIRRMMLPDRFNDVVNQDVLERAFRGIDSGELDKDERRTGWALDESLDVPREDRIRELLGAPNQFSETSRRRSLDYEYTLSGQPDAMPNEIPAAAGHFVFDRPNGQLIHARIRVGILTVIVKGEQGMAYHAEVRR